MKLLQSFNVTLTCFLTPERLIAKVLFTDFNLSIPMRFSQKGTKMTAQIHTKNVWRASGLRKGALLGIISDIHRVHTNLEDPVDVRIEPQQYTLPQAVSSKSFFQIWALIFVLLWENITCIQKQCARLLCVFHLSENFSKLGYLLVVYVTGT